MLNNPLMIAATIALTAVTPATAGPLTRSLVPGSSPPKASLADLSWIEGEWEGAGFESILRETYSSAAGGQMVGHFSAVKDGKPGFYEFIMLAQVGDTIEYRVRHFNPDMTAWEEKNHFIRFPLVAVEKDHWFFDGYTLRRTGPDTADHIIRVKRGSGPEQEVVLKYWRVKPQR